MADAAVWSVDRGFVQLVAEGDAVALVVDGNRIPLSFGELCWLRLAAAKLVRCQVNGMSHDAWRAVHPLEFPSDL